MKETRGAVEREGEFQGSRRNLGRSLSGLEQQPFFLLLLLLGGGEYTSTVAPSWT